MTISFDLICYIVAIVFFALAGAGVPKYGWQWWAFGLVLLAYTF